MDIVKEGSTAVLTLSFLDEDGLPVTPSSATYKINNKKNRAEIKSETAITPSSNTHDVEITAAENAIVAAVERYETHVVTVSFTYSGGKVGKSSYEFDVENLRFEP